jgi:6-phosphogluconolactonase
LPDNLAYIGTYTRHGRSDGVQVFSCDPLSGKLAFRSKVAEVDPSFLALHPSGRFLFATSEGLTAEDGAVAAFGIDPRTGGLQPINRQPTLGGEPCHLCVDGSGSFVLVANHENGSVAVFPIASDGHIGPMSDFIQHRGSGPGPTQAGPHAHHVTFDPSGRRVLVTDKGLDQVLVYVLDPARGQLVPNEIPFGRIHAGAAPRHLAFGATGRYAYVNGEADMTLAACTYDAHTGALEEIQVVSTVPDGTNLDGCSTAEVAVEPSGRFVYVSNRGHDSIAVFAIDSSTGRLAPSGNFPTGGRTPRNFAIHPNGRQLYAANQDSDTIAQFAIDSQTGHLRPDGEVTHVGAPVCILFS